MTQPSAQTFNVQGCTWASYGVLGATNGVGVVIDDIGLSTAGPLGPAAATNAPIPGSIGSPYVIQPGPAFANAFRHGLTRFTVEYDSPDTAVSATGGTATATLAAPAGSVEGDSVVAGLTAAETLAALAGSVEGDSVVTGIAATEALAAPAGGVRVDEVVAGAPAQDNLAAPSGSVRADSVVACQAASSVLYAPQGAVSTANPPAAIPGLWTGTVFWATAYTGTATPKALYTGSASPAATYTGKVSPT